MPNKRKKRQQIQDFSCPVCQQRLWRIGSPKYYMYYQGKTEIQENLRITSKKASFIAAHYPVYVDSNTWLEEFFCDVDLKIWMRMFKLENGQLKAQLAKEKDWERTVRTPDPDFPNSTVSEFTYRMSRRTGQNISQYHH